MCALTVASGLLHCSAAVPQNPSGLREAVVGEEIKINKGTGKEQPETNRFDLSMAGRRRAR